VGPDAVQTSIVNVGRLQQAVAALSGPCGLPEHAAAPPADP
jgi:hypothetical protein